MSIPTEQYSAVVAFQRRVADALDTNDFPLFVDLCSETFVYRITTFSPELGREMTWFDSPMADVKALFETMPQHVRMLGSFMRHLSPPTIETDDEHTLRVEATVILLHTGLDGKTGVLAAGRYHDELEVGDSGEIRLRSRHVRLQSRDMGAGPHIPL